MSEREDLRQTGGEFYISRERDVITKDMLYADNKSAEAELRRVTWEENREEKNLTLLATCSDARVVTPNPTSSVVIRSIAVGKNLEPFGKLIEHKSIDNVHIMGHHSGKATVEGEHPRGCGGLGVKEEQLHGKFPHSDLETWVADNVLDSDCLYHSFAKAAEVQEYTEKDILLSTQDHLDHVIYPMAGFFPDFKSAMPHYEDLLDYDPSEVYKKGIPQLSPSELKGTSFEEYLKKYFDEQFPALHSAYREHDRTSQEIQNPKLLLITSNIRPPEVCYPALTKSPNRVFVETVARHKAYDEFKITEKSIRDVVTQARYPITHFTNMKTIFIETGDMAESTKIARALEERIWFPPWMERKRNRILLGESKGGRLIDIKKY